MVKGTSKNEDFRARARKHRAQNRSVYDIHEDSCTELTPPSCEKTIFRGALNVIPVNAGVIWPENGSFPGGCFLGKFARMIKVI